MITKYGFDINMVVLEADIKRLINQLWKLIPMKENNEDWQKQLSAIIVEISGLNEIFGNSVSYLILLSKLEGLKETTEFAVYRKTVFEAISLLDEITK